MIQFGFLAASNKPISEEIKFARKYDFDLIQLWYDSNGLEIVARRSDEFKVLSDERFPTIIHALLDIDELSNHAELILNLARQLGHKSVIIHPYLKNYFGNDHLRKLRHIMEKNYSRLMDNGIDVYVENNCRAHPLLYEPHEIKYFFHSKSRFRFLLDVAHIDSYKHLQDLVSTKCPTMLHLADKHFAIAHEHLPVGQGELDFKLIFSEYLSSFDGKIIFEITQSEEDIVNARLQMTDILETVR